MAARPPLPLRVVNATGRALGAVGWTPVRLDEEALLEAARRRTGLDDFGETAGWRFREPLRLLVSSLEREAHLSLFGRATARRELLRLLENRLRMEDVRRRHPELARVPVRGPLFVLGLPRTGTSLLHELLAQDPANRTPLTWEVMHPWPPPERASFATDPRIARVEKHFAGIDRILPEFRKMHRMGARLPQECVAMASQEFASLVFHTSWRVPSYQGWLDGAELRPVYGAHRAWLQYLGWRCPAERWVLKSPGHLWSLGALLAEYPDARVVMTHRDPRRVLASLASLVATLRSLASEDVDPGEIGADWAERLADGLRRAIDVRDSGALPLDRVVDVHYRELVGREIETVRWIYERFGLELSAPAEERMLRYLEGHPKDRHGEHRYSLAAAGLDPARERRRFAFYAERFGVAAEEVE
jgi:Sulfotransferase family